MQGEVFSLTVELVFSAGYEVRDTVCLCICVQVFEWVMFLELYASPPPASNPYTYALVIMFQSCYFKNTDTENSLLGRGRQKTDSGPNLSLHHNYKKVSFLQYFS